MLDKLEGIHADNIQDLSNSELEDLFYYIHEFDSVVLNFAAAIDQFVSKEHSFGTDHSLNYYKAQILRCINMQPGISATEIAKKLQKTPAYMSKMISELEDIGLITREINPKNRRFFILELTEEGKRYDEAHLKFCIERLIVTRDILDEQGYCVDHLKECKSFLDIMTKRLLSL